MKEIKIEIAELPKMKKYLRVLIGKYSWRVSLYACMDHEDYSPVLEYWLSGGKKSKHHIEHPKLVNCFMLSDFVPAGIRNSAIEALDGSGERAFKKGNEAAAKITHLPEKLLRVFQDEADLIREVLGDENYMFFGSYDRILTYASHLHLRKNLPLGASLKGAEEHFGKDLKHRELFFEYWEKGSK